MTEAERPAQTLDYEEAIAYCFKTLGHAQGTRGCVAFARGAEWAQKLLLSKIDAQAAELEALRAGAAQERAAERERWAAICRGVMAEHGGDPAGQLVDYGNRDRLLAQCQAAGASQVLIRGLGLTCGHTDLAKPPESARQQGKNL